MNKIELNSYNKVLILAVGGGNDSVSSLILQEQLKKDYGYNPNHIDILAIAPSSVVYSGSENYCFNTIKVDENLTREISGHKTNKNVELQLFLYKHKIKKLNIKNVYISTLKNGSIGLYKSLDELIKLNGYDLLIAVDVGGDFIAIDENNSVLSPMMDGMAGWAIKQIASIPVVFAVFGLGTDGESSTEHLDLALSKFEYDESEICESSVEDSLFFYREYIEKNRYSRTADFTIKSIQNNPVREAKYRARFCLLEKIWYGEYIHRIDQKFDKKYYISTDLNNLKNKFIVKCESELDWFKMCQSNLKLNVELNGQYLSDLNGKNILFLTPSFRFSELERKEIFNYFLDNIDTFKNAEILLFREDLRFLDVNLDIRDVSDDIVCIKI
jgi:hypothetical protein